MIDDDVKRDFAAKARAGETQFVAGCFDAMSAMLAEKAGAPAVMTSGFALSATNFGFPDVELYTMTENLGVVRNVANAVNIPVIADADTGYGNAINVMRTVREFEHAGVAAMIFEDQLAPKRCPAVANQVEILPAHEQAGKIRAAVSARRNPDTLIIARTDAPTVSGAIERAKLYVEAGADLVQPISKTFTDLDSLKQLREAAGVPLSLQLRCTVHRACSLITTRAKATHRANCCLLHASFLIAVLGSTLSSMPKTSCMRVLTVAGKFRCRHCSMRWAWIPRKF